MQPPDLLRRFFQQSENPVILIGASVRSAACSAFGAEFDVLAIDHFADSQTQEASAAFLTIKQAAELSDDDLDDLIPPGVPMIVVGGIANDCGLVKRLAKWAYWPGRQEQAFEVLSRPDVLARIAIRSRVQFPSYRLASDCGEDWSQLPTGRWLVKSPNTSGGLGVQWVTPDIAIDSESYLQQWTAGKPYGAVFASCGKEECVLIGVCRSLRQRIGDFPFVYAGSHGPVRLSTQNVARLNSIANLCVGETGYSGLLNVDILIDEQDQMTLLEINPRWSASVEVLERPLLETRLLKARRKTLYGVMDDAIEGDVSNISAKQIEELSCETGRCYKRVVFAKRPGKLDLSQLSKDPNCTWTDMPSDANQRFEPGDPMCTALVKLGRGPDKFSWRKTRRLLAAARETVGKS